MSDLIFLVLDACVLIDYCDSDRGVLRSIGQVLGQIVVVRPVLDEVEQLDEDEALELGLQIVDVDVELAAEAARTSGALSFQDRLCVLLAKREGWTCVTNDGRLRRECDELGVTVVWGLELLLRLVDAGGLSRDEAVEIATAIHESNPRFVTKKVLADFVRKLDTR